jgi:hypothetical protein
VSERGARPPDWWARGLLFENCNCQSVCPGHVHFDQLCTFDRCVGYWTIRIDEGAFGEIDLGDVRAVLAYDSPQHMIDGDWIESIVIDEAASREQRSAVETILTGRAGGPWETLARFVGRRLETRFLPIRIDDEERRKRVVIPELLDGTVEPIRGRDRDKPVRLENMFNQIHAKSQVIATGATSYDDGEIVIDTQQSHALWSSFDWSVSGS